MVKLNWRRSGFMPYPNPTGIFGIALLLLLHGRPCIGTSIVVAYEPGTPEKQAVITAGADSRENWGGIPRSACKIRTCRNGFFTFTGARDLYLNVPGVAFDPIKTVEGVCRSADSLYEYVVGTDSAMREALATVGRFAVTHDQRMWQTQLRGHPIIAEPILLGIQGGVPMMIDLRYGFGNSPEEIVVDGYSCPDQCSETRDVFFPFGIDEHIQIYEAEHPEALLGQKSEVIERLITVQANATPQYVGGDIDLVQITETRTRWIRRKAECDENGDNVPLRSFPSPVPLFGLHG
ncbi:MAG: hypothetical protein ABSA52_05630 [Candidatus Binatia bacterium]|jgi:hypothetical protein